MGFYVNPKDQSKEAFLQVHGAKLAGAAEAKRIFDEGADLPVCLVDNGMFTAAGVGFSHREIEHFSEPGDPRRKAWFSVPRDKLFEVTDGLREYFERGDSD